MKVKPSKDKARIKELERLLREAEAAYESEKLKREIYQKALEIAEEELEIPLRKKYGAKRLRK